MPRNKTVAGLLVGGGLLWVAKHAMAGDMGGPMVAPKRYGAPMQLTTNFNLSEFMDEHKSMLDSYKLTEAQLANVNRLAKVCQILRDKYGPIRVTSGGRPQDWKDTDGRGINEILVSKGYKPASDSDHNYFAAGDLQFNDLNKYPFAAADAAKLPDVRQVILEYKTVSGAMMPMALHVAVVSPGKGKIPGKNYAFVQKDGDYFAELLWNQSKAA